MGQAKLCRVERRRRRRETERTNFFREPFKHKWQWLDEKQSGKLETSKEEVWSYMKSQYSDIKQAIPLGSPWYAPYLAQTTMLFDTFPLKLLEVEEVVKKARPASAPGPCGLPYKLYNNCSQVVKILWRLMKMTQRNQQVPA